MFAYTTDYTCNRDKNGKYLNCHGVSKKATDTYWTLQKNLNIAFKHDDVGIQVPETGIIDPYFATTFGEYLTYKKSPLRTPIPIEILSASADDYLKALDQYMPKTNWLLIGLGAASAVGLALGGIALARRSRRGRRGARRYRRAA